MGCIGFALIKDAVANGQVNNVIKILGGLKVPEYEPRSRWPEANRAVDLRGSQLSQHWVIGVRVPRRLLFSIGHRAAVGVPLSGDHPRNGVHGEFRSPWG
jgi:hypothetical protein